MQSQDVFNLSKGLDIIIFMQSFHIYCLGGYGERKLYRYEVIF